MTAYLQPGDTIHLAVPFRIHMGTVDIDATNTLVQELIGFYHSMGVTVGHWTPTRGSDPLVVAVFRGPEVKEESR